MNRDKIFIGLYGYFEVGLNILSGSLLIFAPVIFLQATAPGMAGGGLFAQPLLQNVVQLFGYMIITLGLVQFPAIHYGNYQVRQGFLVGLTLGDVFHVLLAGMFAFQYNEWTFAVYYGFFMAGMLALSRIYFLVTGVPGEKG
jgi:hypothetical protein